MLKSATSSITKQFQKQQILSVITTKYMDLLALFDKLLVDNNDIKTIINMTKIIKKTNPLLMAALWNTYLTHTYKEEIEQVNNGDYTFWLNNNFDETVDKMTKEEKWCYLGKSIINEGQKKIKNGYNNQNIKLETQILFKTGYEINKLIKLYYSL